MKTILFLGFLSTSLALFSQSNNEILKKANDFVSNKKYSYTFKTLNEYDPKDNIPEIVIQKERIVLDYFVTSIMHRFFALKDLRPDEDILQYRGQQGEFDMFAFGIDSILGRLIKIYPNDCELKKGLADYYYEVYLKYPDGWFKPESEILDLMEKNYKDVVSGECADDHTFNALGFINLSRKNYKESIPFYKKSIELNKSNVSSYYNLGYAYLFSDDRENALTNAKIAFDLYEDKNYKSDAAIMIAQIYSELKDDKNTLLYLEKGNEILPNNYSTLRRLLLLYVKNKDPKTDSTRLGFYNLAPDNPTIYNDLSNIYFTNNRSDELIKFFKEQLQKYTTEFKIIGSLDFYLARLYLESHEDIDAKNYFLLAKDNLSKVLNSENQVFQEIDKELKKFKE